MTTIRPFHLYVAGETLERIRARGGHFAALEEPELLIDDIRAFARGLR